MKGAASEYSAANGYLVGRAARLADWQFRRERKDEARLVAVLRARKWAREHTERRREISREYMRRQAPAQKAALAAETRATVLACADCGVEFCRLPGVAGRPMRFCSARCAKRFSQSGGVPASERVDGRSSAGRARRATPWTPRGRAIRATSEARP